MCQHLKKKKKKKTIWKPNSYWFVEIHATVERQMSEIQTGLGQDFKRPDFRRSHCNSIVCVSINLIVVLL